MIAFPTRITARSRGILANLARVCRDSRGFALTEFAYSFPIVFGMGAYGIEVANFAVTHMRVSQIALSLADNASRVGLNNGLSAQQMRESDVNDIFQGVRLQSGSLNFGANARVTLSSLEYVQQTYDTAQVVRIHWQRCMGKKSGTDWDSSYGTTSTSAGTTSTSADKGTDKPLGMGDTGKEVIPPDGSAVMFVEVNYEYQPIFGTLMMAKQRMHYVSSFIVRDKRDFTKIYNPTNPATARATCDLHNA